LAVKVLREAKENLEDYSIEEVVELYNDGYIEIMPKNPEFVIPWDAVLDYDSSKGTIIMRGGAGPGGYGSCVVTFPAKDFFKIFVKM